MDEVIKFFQKVYNMIKREYNKPSVETAEIFIEGILCASGDIEDGGNGGYLEDNEWGTF